MNTSKLSDSKREAMRWQATLAALPKMMQLVPVDLTSANAAFMVAAAAVEIGNQTIERFEATSPPCRHATESREEVRYTAGPMEGRLDRTRQLCRDCGKMVPT